MPLHQIQSVSKKQMASGDSSAASKGKKSAPAFTLIELVVVIAILAILGTIGFLSIGGYSSRARDSARVADVSLMSKSLDVSVITVGNYPLPDNYFSVTYSGGTVWYQGVVGNGVLQKLHTSIAGGGLDSKPVDPLKGSDYVYSMLAEGRAYQVKAEYENDLAQTAMGAFETAYAAPGAPTIAYVRGNYGGLTAKTTTGSLIYVLALPSIITNSGTVGGGSVEIKTNALSGTLVFNGKNLLGASNFNPIMVVYSGATLPKDDTAGQITSMVTALKTAYSGSDIASNSAISTLLTTPVGSLGIFGTSILTGQLGGSAVVGGSFTGGTVVAGAFPPAGITFTSCGAYGRYGPSAIGSCGYSWPTASGGTVAMSSTQGYQLWTVPSSGQYVIEAVGAGSQGPRASNTARATRISGKGAKVVGTFSLNAGDSVLIAVGQYGYDYYAWGGGGGTFVALWNDKNTATAMVVAGGGGGHAANGDEGNPDAPGTALWSEVNNCNTGYAGGCGGGFAMITSDSYGGQSFRNGLSWGGSSSYVTCSDGTTHDTNGDSCQYGGFGGGGGTGASCSGGGGGGGYGNSNSGDDGCGGRGVGGWSYNSGTNQSSQSGFNQLNGWVKITKN